MARTPWGKRASYGAELAKRKMAVEGSKASHKKSKSISWGPFILAGAAFYFAITGKEPQTYLWILAIGGTLLGIYWSSR